MNKPTNAKKEEKKIIQCVTHSSVALYDTSSTSTSFLLYQRKICFSRVRKFKLNQTKTNKCTRPIYSITCCTLYTIIMLMMAKNINAFLYIDLKSVASSLLFVSIFYEVFFSCVCLFFTHSVVWVCCTIFTAIYRFYLCNARIFSFFFFIRS